MARTCIKKLLEGDVKAFEAVDEAATIHLILYFPIIFLVLGLGWETEVFGWLGLPTDLMLKLKYIPLAIWSIFGAIKTYSIDVSKSRGKVTKTSKAIFLLSVPIPLALTAMLSIFTSNFSALAIISPFLISYLLLSLCAVLFFLYKCCVSEYPSISILPMHHTEQRRDYHFIFVSCAL